ncbi:hypothetical protein CH296_00480 [Rhodococcus sp. 14-2496-1d]|uniref:hypothetical protein n=1 Tax=Rhodococcus sp. 14-2496-1d TaxID=2023146 RepID=UPI000B9B705D|nr:hypothetical protein [Rhodococcus sp. 14-2496-1d]OZF40766.1 hypothetical protein CH296_00480 [Rhodococcus sp. 14-2496-1d]
MTAEQMPAVDYSAITWQNRAEIAESRERDALKAADTFAQDFHAAAADRDRARATLKDIREYVADLRGDPALTTRRNIADELTKILEYIR